MAPEYFCAWCGTPFASPYPLDQNGCCALCRLGLTGFDRAYSYGSYDGTLRRLIQIFKYERIQTMAGPLGRMLGFAIPRDCAFDLVVPMPMHWRRRLRRGFNQAALLAETVGRRTGLPVVAAVRRRKSTAPQAGMTRAQRRANVTGAFVVSRTEAVRGKRVLLVDDVLTTGATAGACARVLKSAGATHVSVLTVARADRRPVSIVAADSEQNSFSITTPGGVH